MTKDDIKNHSSVVHVVNYEDVNEEEATKRLRPSDGDVGVKDTKVIKEPRNRDEGMLEEMSHLSQGPPWYKSKRYILSYILFGGIMNSFVQRAHLGIAIVCMTNHTATSPLATPSAIGTRPDNDTMPQQRIDNKSLNYDLLIEHNKYLSGLNSSSGINGRISFNSNETLFGFNASRRQQLVLKNEVSDAIKTVNRQSTGGCLEVVYDRQQMEDGPFLWDKRTQGLLLGAVYWTYIAMAFPGNTLIRYVSKKRVIAVSSAMISGLTMLTHVAALWSPWAVFAIKLAQGGFTGLSVLSIYGLWTRWGPPLERTGLIAISFGGSVFGLAIVFPISGFLCKYGFWGGWPSVFYFSGFVGLGWSLIFMMFTSESPALHSSISPEERHYIETSLASSISKSMPPIPWRSILLSPPVWAIICIQSTYSWALYMVVSTMPQYMKEVLKFKIDSNGLFMMPPFLMTWILSVVCGQVINRVLRSGKIRVVSIRKIHAVIANVFPAILLFVMSFLDCTFSALAVVILTLAVGIMGTSIAIFLTAPYDIAPQFAQPIVTVTNAFGSLMGILAPYVITAITKDKTLAQWQAVLYLTSGVLTFGAIVFCVLAKGEIQHWAVPRGESGEAESHGEEEIEDEVI